MQQLDIFADSRDRVLINRLAEALATRAATRPFDSATPELHASALWLQGQAWAEAEQPLLSTPLQAALADSDQAPVVGFKLMNQLLGAERQGRHHDLVGLRKQLQSLKPVLFVAYMSTR